MFKRTIVSCCLLLLAHQLVTAMELQEGAGATKPSLINQGTPMITKSPCKAAKKGSIVTLQKLAEAGVSLEKEDAKGYSPLHRAAEMGQVKAVVWLLSKGVNPNKISSLGLTAAYLTTIYNHKVALDVLLNPALVNCKQVCPADLNQRNTKIGDYQTALGRAICMGNLDMAQHLFAKGATIEVAVDDIVTKPGEKSPFRTANKEFCEILVQRGLDLNYKNKYRHTILHEALCSGDQDFICSLIEAGAHSTPETQEMHIAAMMDMDQVVSELLESQDPVDGQNKEGEAPLHVAAKHGSIASMIRLIADGANINAITKKGNTPLHYAAKNGQVKVALLLAYLGANSVIKNKKRRVAGNYVRYTDNKEQLESYNVLLDLLSSPREFMRHDESGEHFAWIEKEFPKEFEWLVRRHAKYIEEQDRLEKEQEEQKAQMSFWKKLVSDL